MTQGVPAVYIVDSDVQFSSILLAVLKKYGVRAESFPNFASALKKTKALPPDLFMISLLDVSREKSIDPLAALRMAASKPELPILLLSDQNEMDGIVEALDQGASDYLLKPLDRDILTSKLLQFIYTAELGFTQSENSSTLQIEFETTLNLELNVLQVEEDGVILLSKNLILRGSVVNLGGNFIQEIASRDKPILATVITSEFSPKLGGYVIYVDFDSTDKPLIASVRAWLALRWTKPVASPDGSSSGQQSSEPLF